MATLTGFKQVKDDPHAAGQVNPVFVLEDVDAKDEQFEDARSSLGAGSLPKAPMVAGSAADSDRSQPAIELDEVPAGANRQPARADAPSGDAGERAANNNRQPDKLPSKDSSAPAPASSVSSGLLGAREKRQMNNSAALNNDHKTLSASLLAVDCLPADNGDTGSRSPRRSPLMSLFRGKPRESVRRMYTDEDQFEVEWANVSLEVQTKWSQRLSASRALASLLASARAHPDEKWAGHRAPPKLILNGVNGRFQSGQITAILGPSGAGKTSLLNSLFGKHRTNINGSIKVTGAPTKKRLTVCTIPQSDYLIDTLTTEESLWYASRLKNCEHDFNHDRNIERVIELLGLQRCRHTRIAKLSGGQYKRVSIAQEMLSSPDILVLDEPTSGLDSLTCYRTVKVLRDLVEASKAHNLVNPMSILLTIHQPHQDVLNLFHSVYVMAVGGQTLYHGPPSKMEEFISKNSSVQMPADGYNPASFLVELASEEYGREPIDTMVSRSRDCFYETSRHKYPDALFRQSPVKDPAHSISGSTLSLYESKQQSPLKKGDSTVALHPASGKADKFVEISLTDGDGAAAQRPSGGARNGHYYRDVDPRIMSPRSGKNSDGVFWHHVGLMTKRCLKATSRDPMLCMMRIAAHIFVPLFIALIYGPNTGKPNACPSFRSEINLLDYASRGVEEIQAKQDELRVQFQNVGLHFMIYYAFALCMLALTAISFPMIMHVLIKEIRNGWYSLGSFIVGKFFAELPLAVALPPISVGVIYYLTGQPPSPFHWRYMVQSLIMISLIMIAESQGLIFGALFMNSMQTAVFAASVSTVPFIILCGFLLRIRELPYFLQYVAHLSYFKMAVEALIITRYGFGMCGPCDSKLLTAAGAPTIVGIPPNIMSLTDYYLNSLGSSDSGETSTEGPQETGLPGNVRGVDFIVDAVSSTPESLLDREASSSTTTERAQASSAGLGRVARAGRSRGGGGGRRRGKRDIKRRSANSDTELATTTQTPPEEERPKQGKFFTKLGQLLTRANAFGFKIESCDDVLPMTMKDMSLKDDMLGRLLACLYIYIFVLKIISYYIVEISVKLKL